MTSGAIATTRRSTAAAVHVVHPRLEAPATTKRETVVAPPAGDAENAVTASIARTALFVIGNWAGQRASPVSRNLAHVYAMKSSSARGFRAGSLRNVIG